VIIKLNILPEEAQALQLDLEKLIGTLDDNDDFTHRARVLHYVRGTVAHELARHITAPLTAIRRVK
jgi:hypothetical protein